MTRGNQRAESKIRAEKVVLKKTRIVCFLTTQRAAKYGAEKLPDANKRKERDAEAMRQKQAAAMASKEKPAETKKQH